MVLWPAVGKLPCLALVLHLKNKLVLRLAGIVPVSINKTVQIETNS
jgi:hypothetical protein